jgi:hypothetical protein
MRWLYLFAYGAAVAGFVYIFFRVCLRERDPKALPAVAAALMFSLVVVANTYNFWWLDNAVNRGVQE